MNSYDLTILLCLKKLVILKLDTIRFSKKDLNECNFEIKLAKFTFDSLQGFVIVLLDFCNLVYL